MCCKSNSVPIPDQMEVVKLLIIIRVRTCKKEKGVTNHFTFEYRPRLKSGQAVVRMAIKSRRCR